MMKTIFSILFFSIGIGLMAQTVTDAEYNAQPDNNPFHSGGNMGNVNTYTGKAAISIPLYTVNFGELDIPINLVYNSEGIQVDQYASEVGLGWSLSSLGEIIKEVNGSYEDNEGRDNWKAYLQTLPQNLFTSDVPDYYTINSPNISGKFFIDTTFTVREIEGLNTANIMFTRSRTADSEIFKYGIVTNRQETGTICGPHPNGLFTYFFLNNYFYSCTGPASHTNYFDTQNIKIIKDKFTYNFSEFEHIRISTETKDVAFRDSQAFPPEGVSTSEMDYHTGLKLTEIKDNNTNNTLQISYRDLARLNGLRKADKVWSKLIHRVDNGFVTNYSRINKDFDVRTSEAYIRKLPTKIKTKDVEVVFNYDNAREDKITKNIILSEIPSGPAPGTEYVGPAWNATVINPLVQEPLLRSIMIKNNLGQIVMQYNFVYGYFDSGCSDADICKRLKLLAIEKGYGENNVNKETYKFSYYEDKALPKISSLSKDVFGFKSDIVESTIKDSYGFPIRPFSYQYTETRNGINLSYFSPLKVQALNPVMTSGEFEQGIASFENIRAWTLKTITYPTQGVQSFTYEPHEFDWKGTKIKGGGLRIKEISMLDPVLNKTLTTKYSYGDGQASSLPMVAADHDIAMGSPSSVVKESVSRTYSTLVNRSKGSYVVYPTSRKTDPDGGYTEFKYSSYTEYPEVQSYKWQIGGTDVNMNMDLYLFSKNAVASKMFNYDYLRGNLLNAKIYDKLGTLLKETEYQYLTTEYPSPPITEPKFHPRSRILYYPVTSNYEANFPGPEPQYTSSVIKRNNLVSIKEKNYLSGAIVNSEKNITYTDRYNLIKTITSSGPVNSDTQINNYAFEGNNPLLNGNVNYEQIKTGTDKKNGNEEVEKTKITHATLNGLVVPNTFSTFDYAANEWNNKLSFDIYDNKGNILQVSGPQGSSVVIWGYNQTKPIARIEGATYAQVMQAFGLDPASNVSYLQLEIVKKSDLDVDDASENQLLSELATFKSNPNLKPFQVSTESYDPLIGVKTITSVSGLKTKYVYDASNRVQKILDNDGKTVKEHKYNFAAVRYYNSEKKRTFAKNCGSSGVGTVVTYVVPENTYSSTSSQAEADSKAENDVNANGQNFANNNGTCTPFSCSIVGIIANWHYGTIYIDSASPANYKIKMEYNFQSGLDWQNGNGVLVGKITGNCLSSNVRYNSTYSSGVWGITVNPNGDIYVKFIPGATSAPPANNTVILLDFFLPIN